MRLRVGAILLAILAVVAAPTFAQSVTGGVKVGVNFAKVTAEEDDETFETDMKPGLVIGAGVEVPITELFAFQPEFLYSMKGGKSGSFFGDADDIKLKIDMVQIPLLFKASFASATVRPFIVVGPAFGFVTSAKVTSDDFDDEDIKDDVETVEFSGIVGAGLQFGRGTLEVRYDHGFNDLDKDDFAEAKTRTFSVLFGFGFGG